MFVTVLNTLGYRGRWALIVIVPNVHTTQSNAWILRHKPGPVKHNSSNYHQHSWDIVYDRHQQRFGGEWSGRGWGVEGGAE